MNLDRLTDQQLIALVRRMQPPKAYNWDAVLQLAARLAARNAELAEEQGE
jgi:hypothetical protein